MYKAGILLISASLVLWLFDRTTLYISTAIGALYCGENYLQPVNGIVGDSSCGFNMDMYVALFFLLCMLLGSAFLLAARKQGDA